MITGAEHGELVAGACVSIGAGGCAALSDARGLYLVRGIPVGPTVVTTTAIGRAPHIDTVNVAPGAATTLDVHLQAGPILLSTMVTTATRVPTEAAKVATTINVLTPFEVKTSPARESQDMLREIPGVELPRTSSLVGGTAQIVSIRGVDEGRTAVLLDGIPINDAWGEWIDWGRVPKGSVDHVEVIEGGTSNLYGNGAIGGVISFFSKPLRPGDISATFDAGSRDAKHGYVGAGIPVAGAFSATVSGDIEDGGGYTMIDPAKAGAVDVASTITQRSGSFRLNYAPSSAWSGFAGVNLFGDDRNLGTPLSAGTRTQHEMVFGVNHGTAETGALALRAWDGHMDEFQRATTIRANSSNCAVPSAAARECEDSASTALIPSDDAGASLVWSRNGLFGLASFTIGGDYRHMGGEYDESDFNTSCPGANCGHGTRTIASGGDQYLSGAFIQAISAPTADLRIELSARFDRWENNNGHSDDPIAGDTTYINRSKNAFSPRVGLRYQLLPGLSAHAAYYKAFRAPNLAELYRKQINANGSQITIPNPDLDAETGIGWEGGVDWQPVSWVQLKGTAYTADYNNFNVPVTISAGPPAIRTRENISKARSKGAEIYLALRPAPAWLVTASAGYDNDRVVASDSTNGNKVNRVPSPRYTLRASYTSRVLGTYTGIYRYEGQTTTLQGLPLAPFGVVDLNGQRDLFNGVSIFASVENVGNEQYQVNIAGTGAAALISYGLPRTIRVGLNWWR